MPSFFTHQIVAEQVLLELPKCLKDKITEKSCYFLGAQGSDHLFFYSPIKNRRKNLGVLMHRNNVYETFESMLTFCRETECLSSLSFVIGYISHYATDIIFHPYVYALENKIKSTLKKSRQKDRIHSLIEGDVDYFLYEKYYDFPIKKFKYPYACNQSQYAELFKLYDYIFRRVYYVKINPKKLKKSFDTFLFLQRYFLDKFSYRRRFFYALEKVTFSPHIVSFMFMRDVPNPKFENYSRQNIGGVNNNIYELCEKSIKLSVSLIKDFYKSLSNKTPLNKQKFSTDFNIGKVDKQRT